jgi:hypothetical protein
MTSNLISISIDGVFKKRVGMLISTIQLHETRTSHQLTLSSIIIAIETVKLIKAKYFFNFSMRKIV